MESESVSQKLRMKSGTEVGALARKLFPNGIAILRQERSVSFNSLKQTTQKIEEGFNIMYEAAFQFEDVYAATDILTSIDGKYKCYEVKSSTEIKEVHIIDAALQYYIISNSGVLLDDIFIVYINNQYVINGELDVNQLFNIKSVLEEVLKLQDFIKRKIAELLLLLASGSIPEIGIGDYCDNPYPCVFLSQCWKPIPSVSIFNLVRLNTSKKFELYNRGVIEFKDIPVDFILTEKQKTQVESFLQNKSIIDVNEIRKYVGELSYPLYFMDFETYQTAIPQFIGTKPYQQIPFQYSLHFLESADATLSHQEYLACSDDSDPRLQLIESLLKATEKPGLILTYNQSFEITRLKELSIAFPGLNEAISERISRIRDLMLPFQSGWIYNPEMNGSYSIKKVLPALFPDLRYEDLEIGDGGTASFAYLNSINNSNFEEVEKIRINLLEYCKMDTYAMVKLFEYLKSI